MTAQLKTNNFNLGNNVVPTAANSSNGGSAFEVGTATGTPTLTMLDAARHGTSGQGLRVVSTTATDVLSYSFNMATPAMTFVARYYFLIDSVKKPANQGHTFCRWRNSTTNILKILVTHQDQVQIQTGSGGGIKNFQSNTALANGWYFFDLSATIDPTTAANGSIDIAIKRASDNGTISDGTYVGAADLGITACKYMQFGKPEAGTTVTLANGFDTDNPAFDVGTTTKLGPVAAANVGPTVSLVPTLTGTGMEPGLTQTLTVNATDSDGTISSRSVTQTSGTPTVTLTNTSTTTWTYELPGTMDGTTLQFQATATDNSGSTTTSAAISEVVLPHNEWSWNSSGLLVPAYFETIGP